MCSLALGSLCSKGWEKDTKNYISQVSHNLVQIYWKIKESSLQISYVPEHTVLYLWASLLSVLHNWMDEWIKSKTLKYDWSLEAREPGV